MVVRTCDFQTGQKFREHVHECHVFRTPARHDDFAKRKASVFWRNGLHPGNRLRTEYAMDSAVIAVAVATTSSFATFPQERTKSESNSRPNSSRPAVFGGLRRKKGRDRTSSTTRSRTRPRAAIRPSRSNDF